MKNNWPFFITYMIFIVIVGCSEFNQPMRPAARFSDSAEDTVTYSEVMLSEFDGEILLRYNGDLKDYYDAINARFFLKERKDNEYSSDDLALLPVDFIADFYLRKIDTGKIATEARLMVINPGDLTDTVVTWIRDNRIYIPLELSERMTVYFWQVEFYFPEDTVRLPEKPGIWYFDRDD